MRIFKTYIQLLFFVASGTLFAQDGTDGKMDEGEPILERAIQKMEAGTYKESLIDFKEYIRLNEPLEDYLKLGDAHAYSGILHSNMGNYDLAIEAYKKSQSNYEKINHLEGLADVTNNIGSTYYYTGDYLNTLKFYRESLAYRKAINDTIGLAIVTQNIGLLFSKTGDFSQAQKHYEQALAIFEQLDYQKAIAETCSNLGGTLTLQARFSEAETVLKRALNIANKLGNRQLRLGVLASRGELAFERSFNEEASALFQQVFFLADSLDSPWYQSQAKIALGKLANRLHGTQKAVEHCSTGLKIAEKMQSIPLQKEAHDCLYQSYKKLGNPLNALQSYEQSVFFKNQLKTDETANRLLGMQFKNQQLADSLTYIQKEHELELAHQTQILKKERQRNGVLVSLGFIVIIAGGLWSRLAFVRKSKKIIEFEKQRSENLLLNILPEKIAEELKDRGQVQAQGFQQVGVLFTDFKSFTKTAQDRTPQEIVEELNICFSAFDRICEQYQIEKIKTIGDAYMAVGGIPVPHKEAPVRIVKAGLAMQEFMAKRRTENRGSKSPIFEMRVGIHTGPLIAGVVGLKKFQYDVWGDTVNTASRLESNGLPGKVNISQSLYALINGHPDFSFECRGNIYVKGKGELTMYFVETAKNHPEKEKNHPLSIRG